MNRLSNNQLEHPASLRKAVIHVVTDREEHPEETRLLALGRLDDRLAMDTQVSGVRSYLSLERC